MIPMNPEKLLAGLAKEGVDFVLIGGLAAAFHGTTRVTKDIDIVYARHTENLSRLCKAMNHFEPRRIVLGKPEGGVIRLTPQMLRNEGAIQLATSAGEVDLLDRIRGFASYSFLKRSAEVRDDLGIRVTVLSIDGLIRSKRHMHRGKDEQDIVELNALKEAQAAAQAERI